MVKKDLYIELKSAGLGYAKSGSRVLVLNTVNLGFCKGELVGIVGLNGIGKSTLLKTISGLLPLLEGEIMVEGESLSHIPAEELSKKISVVLTERVGGFNLTVYDVVASGQMPYTDAFHRLREENRKIIEEALSRCGISEYRNKPVTELSDGLFQKTIIAKALAQQTPCMLLDEPSAYLDYASKHSLFILLRELAGQENKSILVSSHDLDLLLKYCDKLLIISGNKTELIAASDAQSHPGFKEVGGGFI
jgi:iron complex transport system ATP-binding protein